VPAKKSPHSTGARKGPLVGSHMSIAGGVYNAILHAEAVDCACVQLFVKSSNQWRAKPLSDEEVTRFHDERKRTGIGPAVAHSSYLINVGSPDPALFEKSREALAIEYERCTVLGVEHLVFHPGAHTGDGPENAIDRIAKAMDWVLAKHKSSPTVLMLETTAGAGSHIGSTFEELKAILDKLDHGDRAAVCLDTCHVFSAGYDIRKEAGYKATMKQFDDIIGIGRLKAIHCNDSKFDLGTHKDRHEHLGKGFIGKDAFGFIMRDARLKNVPKIIETEKDEDGTLDRMNLGLLRELAGA